MSEISFPVQGYGRSTFVDPAPKPGRFGTALLAGVAGAALLAGANGAAAQALVNTNPYTNAGPYTGAVISNISDITNEAPGHWTGDVNNDGGIANALGATWDGDLNNTGFVTNYGTWTGGANVYDDGVLWNSGAGAHWTGSVENDSQITNKDGATWTGDVVSNNNVIFNETGGNWYGDVLASGGGSNARANIDNSGNWFGNVVTNASMIFNDAGSWTGDVHGNTGSILNGGYSDADRPAEWTGDVLSNNHRIRNYAYGIWNGDVIANAGEITNRGAWKGNLTTSGTVIHTGVWTGDVINTGTSFSAENQIIGALDNRGAVQLTGDLSGIIALANSGVLDLTHDSGAQTLSVGTVVLTSSSSYQIDVTAAGATDRIVATGAATLGGAVRVLASTTGGPYASPTNYTILTAGSINGSFAGVTTDLAFFAPHLSYGETEVLLTLKRNDVGLPDIGATANQRSVGATVEALGAGNPLYDAALWLTSGQAQHAFDQLSGQALLASETMALETSNLVADLALDRLSQIFGRLDGGGDSASGYAGRPVLAARPAADTGFWTQFYGTIGSLAATADTASLTASTGGVAIGLDGALDDWQLGAMLHAGFSNVRVAALNSTSAGSDYGLGVYGGRAWGDTRLALGALHTQHGIHSTRNIGIPGFIDTLSADYAAGTTQAFAELSQAFDFELVSLLPYVGLAHVRQATDGFAETGAAAVLSSPGHAVAATFTSVGLRAEQKFVVGDDMLLTARGSLGWRHAFADTPAVTHALAGGASFSVVGAPLASDKIGVGAGLNLDVSDATMLDVSYDGQFGSGAQTHSLNGTWAIRF